MEKSFFNSSGIAMYEGDHSSGLSRTKRNYTCSFCKRQFNTAQALGGHMNVHRRDRARLRQLPSWVFHCHQNPNPNSSSSSSTSLPSCNSPNPTLRTNPHSLPSPLPHRESNRPIINSKSPRSEIECFQSEEISINKKCKVGVVDEVEGIMMKKGFSSKYEMEKHMKNHELISLDLEIGCKDSKEVLDLELRLGYC